MKRAWLRAGAIAAAGAVLTAPIHVQPAAASGPAIQRLTNRPDGAPAFEVRNARGQRVSRIDCIWNGWYDADAMATRLLASPAVMAAVVAKGGLIDIADLGPAVFDCVVVRVAAPPP